MAIRPIQQKLLSKRTQALLSHPQGMGNYFTFKSAIDILGLDWNDVAPGGVYAVTGKGRFRLKDFDPGRMTEKVAAPWHPGAIKFYTEIGQGPPKD